MVRAGNSSILPVESLGKGTCKRGNDRWPKLRGTTLSLGSRRLSPLYRSSEPPASRGGGYAEAGHPTTLIVHKPFLVTPPHAASRPPKQRHPSRVPPAAKRTNAQTHKRTKAQPTHGAHAHAHASSPDIPHIRQVRLLPPWIARGSRTAIARFFACSPSSAPFPALATDHDCAPPPCRTLILSLGPRFSPALSKGSRLPITFELCCHTLTQHP
ncbi:hypothetical protein DFJ73DRAFT_453164 [Zopfochytrium polystomum]|nr:hypothetical protein DFJ73DRAFT_453164 [Zopfochytrium polystomum]